VTVLLYGRSILILVIIKKLKVVVRISHHRLMWLVDKMSLDAHEAVCLMHRSDCRVDL